MSVSKRCMHRRVRVEKSREKRGECALRGDVACPCKNEQQNSYGIAALKSSGQGFQLSSAKPQRLLHHPLQMRSSKESELTATRCSPHRKAEERASTFFPNHATLVSDETGVRESSNMSTETQTKQSTFLVAMSGGVDSSVCAAMLADAGHRVVGVFMRNGVKHDVENAGKPNKQGCCSIADSNDAALVASAFGVPFYVLNFEAEFTRIIDYFMDEYRRGRTPNPCVVCNNDLKFGRLIQYADDVGAERVITGHYAQVREERGRWRLFRGVDKLKDQTYYLFGLTQDQLARCDFPLGAMTKAEVRELAGKHNLATRNKPESQEICFVPNNDYRTLLRARAPEMLEPGEIVSTSGEVMGEHEGTPAFTIGQRRGLGIGGGTPYYVTELRPESNQVVVGLKGDLLRDEMLIERPNYIGFEAPDAGESFRANVQIRYRHSAQPATLRALADGSLHVQFDQPQSAVTPGQAAVFYDIAENEECLGGGWCALMH